MNDQDAIIQLAARFPLEKLRLVKEQADPSDPDMALLDGAIARLEARDKKVAAQYEQQKLPEPVNPTVAKVARGVDRAGKFLFGSNENGSEMRSLPRRALDFAQGTSAGVLQSIPGVGPGLEAIGDFERTILPGNRPRLFPAPGGLEEAIRQSPSPTISRVAGAVAPAALGAGLVGAPGSIASEVQSAGNISNAPSAAIFNTSIEAAKRIPLVKSIPGAATVVGGGIGGATAGIADAAISRIPDVVIPGRHPSSLDTWNEAVKPGLFGAGMALPGGMKENAIAPGTPKKGKLSGGQIADRYARDRYAGKTYTNEGRDELLRELEDTKARTAAESKAAIEQAKAEAETGVANEARSQELALRERFGSERTAEKKAFDEGIKGVIDNEIVRGKDKKYLGMWDPKQVMDKVREEVSKYAKEIDALRVKSGVGFSEHHMAIGKELASVEEELQRYLGSQASMRDIRNAYLALQKKAESGTPLQKYAYAKIIDHLRTFAEEVDPTGTLKDINARYRTEAHKRERIRGIVYGKEDEKLGTGSQQERFDNPDADVVVAANEISPQEELRGAARLRKTGEPEVAGHDEELRGYGYGDLLDAMEARKRLAQESVAGTESAQAARTAEQVGEVKGNITDYEHGREAALASEWPGTLDIARTLVPGAVGAAVHGSHPTLGLTAEVISAIDLARKLRQPMRSRAAYYLPEENAYKLGISGLQGVLPQTGNTTILPDDTKKRAKLLMEKLRRERALEALGITR